MAAPGPVLSLAVRDSLLVTMVLLASSLLVRDCVLVIMVLLASSLEMHSVTIPQVYSLMKRHLP